MVAERNKTPNGNEDDMGTVFKIYPYIHFALMIKDPCYLDRTQMCKQVIKYLSVNVK